MYVLVAVDKDSWMEMELFRSNFFQLIKLKAEVLKELLMKDLLRNPENNDPFDWIEIVDVENHDNKYWTSYSGCISKAGRKYEVSSMGLRQFVRLKKGDLIMYKTGSEIKECYAESDPYYDGDKSIENGRSEQRMVAFAIAMFVQKFMFKKNKAFH